MPSPESARSDGCIIDGVLSGELDQFDVIVRRYHAGLMRMAIGKLQRTDWAEEAIQETFFSAFKSLHTYDSRYSFRTWLWTIAINQCRRQFKKHQQIREPAFRGNSKTNPIRMNSDQLDLLQCAGPGPQEQAGNRERSEWVAELLARLPDVQADAIRLRFFGGLKYHEIADVMSCGLSTAKHRVRVGLEAVAREITKVNAEDVNTDDSTHSQPRTPSEELHP